MFGWVKANLSKDKHLYQSIKNILGFYPGNIFVYKLAFLHRSSNLLDKNGNKRNNERLEFLGDTVLGTIVSDILFQKYPNKDEGFLTELRSKIVSRQSLNKIAYRMGLATLVKKSKDEHNFRFLEGDALEALIGAIYLDKGYDFTKNIIRQRIIRIHVDIDELEQLEWNYKSKLIDLMQKERKSLSYQVVEVVGSGHRKQYVVEARIDFITYGQGIDFSIKAAEQSASEKAYKKYLDINPEEELEEA